MSKELNFAYESYRSTRDKGLPTVESIEALYPLVQKEVKRTVRYLLAEEPAEDLVVTITTDVLMAIDKFRGRAEFSTWVGTFARNNCRDEIKRRQRERQLFDENVTLDESLVANDDEYAELYQRFETVLNEEERQVLRAKLKGLSGQEIADMVGIPRGSLDRKWFEIKQQLLKILPINED